MDTIVADPLVGRTVDRRYRVDVRIAAGGMAAVYRATDLRLDRTVALKVMKPALADDPEFVARFRDEARAAARLSDPHVVGVYDQGETDGLVYLAMEYVPGRTLRDVLDQVGTLSPEQALHVLGGTLRALSAAHDAGYLHRDIKPENVLITTDDRVKVTDFGLARALETPSPATRGVLIGTAAYLAPEQVSHGRSDRRSDVYQAGVLLYEMLVGLPPHSGESAWEVAYRHVETDVPPVHDRRPDIPAAVARRVTDAPARDPEQRIPTVERFLERTDAVAATCPAPTPLPPSPDTPGDTRPIPAPTTAWAPPVSSPTLADPAPPSGTTRPPSRRRGLVVVTAVVAALVILAGLGGWVSGGAVVLPFVGTEVPRVAGSSETRATNSLTAAGFAVEIVDRRFSERVPAGSVISSDPGGGSEAVTGSTVGLVLSMGPERFEVPDLRGLSPADAGAELREAALTVGGERAEYSSRIPAGMVKGSDPRHGAQVKRDTAVTLVVSRGPAPVDVPDVTGLSRDEATATLEALGLQVLVDEGPVTPLDRVYAQDPPGGTPAFTGGTVTISVF